MEHDSSYRLLYSHRRLVEDLLKGFVDEPWVKDIEWSTLRLEASQHVSSSLEQRRNDLVWRMSLKGGRSLFVYLMMEFQSTVDWHMAVRLLTYLGLFYEGLVRFRQPQAAQTPRGGSRCRVQRRQSLEREIGCARASRGVARPRSLSTTQDCATS